MDCDTCAYFQWDDEEEDYICEADVDEDDLARMMRENIDSLNKDLPAYSRIADVKVLHEEFEKTPKRSIKRYLYQH